MGVLLPISSEVLGLPDDLLKEGLSRIAAALLLPLCLFVLAGLSRRQKGGEKSEGGRRKSEGGRAEGRKAEGGKREVGIGGGGGVAEAKRQEAEEVGPIAYHKKFSHDVRKRQFDTLALCEVVRNEGSGLDEALHYRVEETRVS
jgi:hypothetical protein